MKDSTMTAVSAEYETVTLKMGRHQFSSRLNELLGSPRGDDWGKADLTLKAPSLTQLASLGVSLGGEVEAVEIFTETAIAPLLAFHMRYPDEGVVVAMRVTKGISRLAYALVAEARGDSHS